MNVSKITSKGSHSLNEDAVLVKDNLFAVFDGAGSLADFVDKRGRTGGFLAAQIVKSAFSENDAPLDELARRANAEILIEMGKAGIDTSRKENLWAACVAAVKVHENGIEYFSIGDSLILAIFAGGSQKLLVPYHDHDVPSLKKWEILARARGKNIKERVMPQIVSVRRMSNIDYGVLNGEKSAEKFFSSGTLPIGNLKSVILFTDGLFIPKEDPEQPENWSLFGELYRNSGLKGVLKYVRALEKSDPNCWKYIRLKKHDDATAISIDF